MESIYAIPWNSLLIELKIRDSRAHGLRHFDSGPFQHLSIHTRPIQSSLNSPWKRCMGSERGIPSSRGLTEPQVSTKQCKHSGRRMKAVLQMEVQGYGREIIYAGEEVRGEDAGMDAGVGEGLRTLCYVSHRISWSATEVGDWATNIS
jgi:hypothetical protein